MLRARAEIKCKSCGWVGYPEERIGINCPNCPYLYFEAPEYKSESLRLASKYKFGFLLNPGGGAFINNILGDCQISTLDDANDYIKFLKFLQSKGLESI